MSEKKKKSILNCTVNGRRREDLVPDNMLLADYLREHVGLTGTKLGCDGGECGCCTVLIDGRAQHACLRLAVACEGMEISTVESLERHGRLDAIQQGFHEKLGTQCGYCRPGKIMPAEGLLRANPNPSEEDIRTGLGANICRCTGYVKIIEAVKFAIGELAKGNGAPA